MSGQSEEALSAMKRLPHILTPELLSIESPPMADWTESLLGVQAHVLQSSALLFNTAIILYARAITFAVLGRVDDAEAEQANFEAAKSAVPRSRLNSVPSLEVDVLGVASAMLQGKILYRKGEFSKAFSSLRAATALEDALPYADPPPWMQPARHAIGALLLEQNYVEQTELVYLEDLGLGGNLPRRKARLNNVWGLHGLHECFVREAKPIKRG